MSTSAQHDYSIQRLSVFSIQQSKIKSLERETPAAKVSTTTVNTPITDTQVRISVITENKLSVDVISN